MFCAVDDFVLQVLSQIIKIVTVASHAYNKVAVFLRMFLCIAKGLPINYIELDVMSVHPEIAANQARHLLNG